MTALLLRDTKSPCRAQETSPSPTGKTHYPGATPPSTAPVRCTLFPHFWNASLGAPGGMCEVTPFLGL